MAEGSFEIFKRQLENSILSCPIIYINHYHFSYVDKVLKEIFEYKALGLNAESIVEFDSGQGCIVKFLDKTKDENLSHFENVKHILRVLVDPSIEKRMSRFEETPKQAFENKKIFLFKGITRSLVNEDEVSLMQSFAAKYEAGKYEGNTTIIIVSPDPIFSLPLSLLKFTTVLEILPPTTEEIREYIVETSGTVIKDNRTKNDVDNMVRTLQGLQMYEVRQTLKTVLTLTNRRINDRAVKMALKEKKRIVKKSGIIEVIDTEVRFDQVGGLQKLREDLTVKSAIYNNLGDAEKYKVPVPKGILIIGMPGCGKSMIAQATANLFDVSLLRLDVSRLMGKYVGESEANLRLALATAEAAHPCVLWIDEIEKAFAGGNSKSGDNDMLVMRMMGHFLTWMQERKTPVYIVATANDVMRPEFMRKGRFDEVYFVDFPTESERAQILEVKIRKYKEMKDSIFDFSEIGDCKEVVKEMKGEYGGFSGSEIECVLNMVVEKKFQDYLEQKKAENSQNFVPQAIKIKKDDFKEAVKQIKDSVMANQKSKEKKEKDYLREKTSIERIKEMNETYHFVNASKK